MSSSGLIYAVIVGAWAAYLVPMWLRRQDELNEARPTERFSTAIRLLSGRAGMERRYAKDLEQREERDSQGSASTAPGAAGPSPETPADRRDTSGAAEPAEALDAFDAFEAVDLRSFADPATVVRPAPAADRSGAVDRSGAAEAAAAHVERQRPLSAERLRRAKVLARRRRTTMALFLAFTLGAIVAAVGGLALLWAPAAPAALLSAYIAHLRAQERRRFAFTMDRRRAETAARRLRERGPRSERTAAEPAGEPVPALTPSAATPSEAERRALVEQTDHAEWVDQQRARERGQSEGDGWEPTPVPLPTYVQAPVAPRTTRGVNLDAPDAWSSGRAEAGGQPPVPTPDAAPVRRRPRDRGRTPLFDQYADEDRPRAANE